MRAMRRISGLLCALVFGLVLAGVIAPSTASAHERRELLNGKYQVIVGFVTEPAYNSGINGLDFRVVDKTQKTADGKDKPVEGLEKTLKAQVIVGGGAKTMDLTLKTRFGQPGNYAAYFAPTLPGQYIFRVYGEVEGQKIDERFESGPGRFNDVESIAKVQFPEQTPTVPSDLQARLDAARSQAETARLLAIGGLVVGLLGLGVAVVALLRRPRADAAATPADPRTGGS